MSVSFQSLAASCVLLASVSARAESLVEAREAATLHFRAAAERLVKVKDATARAHEGLRSCRNGALQLQFSETLSRLEAARRTLELGRKQTQALRRHLEDARAELEASHRRLKGRARAGGEANYQDRLLQEYVTPLDTKVVPRIDAYVAGIGGYASLLDRYASFCAQGNYTAAAGQAFVSTLSAQVDELAAAASHLAKDESPIPVR